MSRVLVLIYGVACYLIFLLAGVYVAACRVEWFGPRDATRWPVALLIDILLLLLFGLQHSGMARSAFKRRWLPPPLERSTYVLVSSLALAFLFWQWRPTAVSRDILPPAATLILGLLGILGGLMIVVASFQMNHFDLFGLRQAYLYYRGQPCGELPFQTPGLYRWVRHPMMLGLLLVLWAPPAGMGSLDQLLFASGMTVYVLIGVHLEERGLVRQFGRQYQDYQRRVPMLFPFARAPSENRR